MHGGDGMLPAEGLQDFPKRLNAFLLIVYEGLAIDSRQTLRSREGPAGARYWEGLLADVRLRRQQGEPTEGSTVR